MEKIKSYMVQVYAVLIREGKDIETLPESYILPVAEYLAKRDEAKVK